MQFILFGYPISKIHVLTKIGKMELHGLSKKDSCLLRQTAEHISLHEKQKKCQDVHQKCVCMSKQASQSKSLELKGFTMFSSACKGD